VGDGVSALASIGAAHKAFPAVTARPSLAVLLVTCAGGFLVSLDVSVANALLPAIGTTFRTTDRAALAWIITAYAIVFAAVLVPAGRLADRLGRRRIYMAGLSVFAAGSAVCGLAPDLGLLIAGRFAQGVGAATVSPASMGLLLAAVDAAHRSTYAARWTGVAALGICAGPILGGTLTTIVGWRWAFLVNLPLIAMMCAARRGLPETPRVPGRPLSDPIGAVLLAAGTAAITFGISEAPRWGMTDARIVTGLATGVALIGLFVRRCRRVPSPLLDVQLLLRRQTALASITTALYSCAFFGVLLSFVLFLVGQWRFSLLGAGSAILPMGLIVATMTLRVGQLADRVGFRLPLTVGSTLMAAGLLIAAGGARPSYSPIWLLVVVTTGVGIGLCYPLLIAAAVAGLPQSELSAATAVSQCARQLGAALGIAVTVAVLGPADLPSVGNFQAAWLVGAGFCALAALTAGGMDTT
jgi:EmrB/QacA subfamily drug resistance transporter